MHRFKRIYVFLITVLLCTLFFPMDTDHALAENQKAIEWKVSFDYDFKGLTPEKMLYSSDGGFVFAGIADDRQAGVMKYDKQKKVEWFEVLQGTSGAYIEDFQHTSDKGYIAIGHSYKPTEKGNFYYEDGIYLAKLDHAGKSLWNKVILSSVVTSGWFIRQTADEGYIALADSKTNNTIVKLDAAGNIQWQVDSPKETSVLLGIEQSSDGGFIARFNSVKKKERILVKLDANGQIQWKQSFDVESTTTMSTQTSDGGYLLITKKYETGVNPLHLLKVDKSGKKQWEKSIGNRHDDINTPVVRSKDGHFFVGGSKLIKFDENGNILLEIEGDFELLAVDQASDGGDVVIGEEGADLTYIKFKPGQARLVKKLEVSQDEIIMKIEETPPLPQVFAVYDDGKKEDVSEKVRWEIEDESFIVDIYDGRIFPETYGEAVLIGKYFGHKVSVRIEITDKLNQIKTEWEHRYGTPDDDEGISVQPTADGGYIVGGLTRSYENHEDIRVLKVNEKGKIDWERVYGNAEYDVVRMIRQTQDGGYIVVGKTGNLFDKETAILIKLDQTGKKVWERLYLPNQNSRDRSVKGSVIISTWGEDVRETADGGYIMAGSALTPNTSLTDAYVVKVDKNGKVEWEKTYEGSEYEIANSIGLTDDGGYVVFGSQSDQRFGPFFMKLDQQGNVEWNQTYQKNMQLSNFYGQQTRDGGYVLVGSTYMLKYNKGGKLMWARDFIEPREAFMMRSVQETRDGSYLGLAIVQSSYNAHMRLVKVSGDGELEWKKEYGSTNEEYNGRAAIEADDGGIIIVGSISGYEDNLLLMKLPGDNTEDGTIQEIRLPKEKYQMQVGDTASLKVMASMQDGSQKVVSKGVKWTSSNKSVLYVKDGKIVAKKPGEAVLTVEYKGLSSTITVKVDEKQVLKSLAVSQKRMTGKIDDQVDIILTATYANDEKVDVTESASWSSSNEKVATVQGGTITLKEKGKATIKAKYRNKMVTISITVK